MNNRVIWTIITLMALSLIGLTSFQVYWINNAIKLSNERFNKDVHESLNMVAYKLERSELANVALKSNFFFFNSDTSNSIKQPLKVEHQNGLTEISKGLNVIVFDSSSLLSTRASKGGARVFKSLPNQEVTHNVFIDDSLDNMRVEFIITADSESYNLNIQRVLKKTEEFNNVIHAMVSEENVDMNFRIKPEEIDSLLKLEFKNKGIDIYFDFGVYDKNTNHFVFIDTANTAIEPLMESPLKASLFPNDILGNATFLVVNFPAKDQFLFKKILATLSSSIILLLVIIACFSYAIYIILKQKKLSNLKNDFINNMTHEFKTPIATVSLAAEALSDANISMKKEFVDKYVAVIKDETKRLGTQVEQVLQAAIMDKEDLKINKSKQDINELLIDCVEKAKIQLDQADASITLNLNADNYTTEIDAHHFYNAITSLLDNAIKYATKVPKIVLSTNNIGHQLQIKIKDNAIGISSEQQTHIFEKFYRVPTGNIHNVKGFGLGLSYVHYVIKAHQGIIRVDSALGKGSIFIIDLPLTHEL